MYVRHHEISGNTALLVPSALERWTRSICAPARSDPDSPLANRAQRTRGRPLCNVLLAWTQYLEHPDIAPSISCSRMIPDFWVPRLERTTATRGQYRVASGALKSTDIIGGTRKHVVGHGGNLRKGPNRSQKLGQAVQAMPRHRPLLKLTARRPILDCDSKHTARLLTEWRLCGTNAVASYATVLGGANSIDRRSDELALCNCRDDGSEFGMALENRRRQPSSGIFIDLSGFERRASAASSRHDTRILRHPPASVNT